MARTYRITLDVKLRPLTADELADSGADQLDSDCQPTGNDDDLDEVDANELADLVVFAIESSDDMWGGTSLYAAVDNIDVIKAIRKAKA